MNNLNLMKQRNYVLSLLDKGFNCCKFRKANSKKHEMKKAEICIDVLKKGGFFLTECRFKSGGRADVVAMIDDGITVYEIANSEKEASLKEKMKKYSNELKFEIIRC